MSSDELAVDLVISLYTQSYRTQPKPETKVITVENGRTEKNKSSSISVPVSPPRPKLPPMEVLPKGVVIPPAGSLGAHEFWFALRNAGMRRSDVGRLIRHSALIIPDEKIAVAAYVGYNWHVSHGKQLDDARLKARFALKPEKGNKEYRRGMAATIAGFVHGCPNLVSRHIENLQAREAQALDLALGYEKAEQEAKDEHEKLLLRGKALVERERLIVIRQDLISLAVAQVQKK
jgi:hypothetical protein